MSTETGRGRRVVLIVAGVLMAVAAIVVFVGSGDGGADRPAGGPGNEAGSRFRGDEPARDKAAPELTSAETEARVARLFIAGFATATGPQRAWGGLLVTDTNYASPSQLRTMVGGLQAA